MDFVQWYQYYEHPYAGATVGQIGYQSTLPIDENFTPPRKQFGPGFHFACPGPSDEKPRIRVKAHLVRRGASC